MDGPSHGATLVHAATRFMPPRLRDEYVPRADLVDRVLTHDARLVVASGPAGSGKSTLLAQAYAECHDAVWLSVEPIDDDAAVLWSALIDSTAATLPGFGTSYRHRLDAGGAEAVDGVVTLFANELADADRPVRFFLDDLHLLSGERSIESLRQFLGQLPPEHCLVTASRTTAPFPLGRLRLERAVVEVGPDDLAMDETEACATLLAAGIEPHDDLIGALVSRTEGWVAGLAWATLAMRATPDGRSFVDTVNSVDGELSEYLIEEVLDQRAPELRNFMLDTSILTRFNASLCDHVRDRHDSRALLDELDRTNSFLVPLDRDGEWFRYHHLVHEVLAARLRRESPEAVPALHRRASGWLNDHHEVVESIRHARAAGDDHVAADILCAHWWEMINGGRIETAYALFVEFGAPAICGYQPLAIAAAILYSLAGDHQSAQVFYQAAERGHHDGPPPDGSASIESSLSIMRGAVAFNGVDAVLSAGNAAIEREPVDSPWRPLAVMLVALGHMWRDELDEAESHFEEAVRFGRSNDAIAVYALAELSLIRLARGDVDAAVASADAACTLAAETGLETLFVTATAHGAPAAAALASGDTQAAGQHLDAARVPMAGVNLAMPIDAMHTRIVLADSAERLGRTAEAHEYVDGATRTRQRYRDTGVLASQLDDLSERLAASCEPRPVELSEREQAVLELMPTELSIQGIADALFVSKETVKTHRRNIYKKLAVGSREDAVVAARHSGLLPASGDISPTDGPS